MAEETYNSPMLRRASSIAFFVGLGLLSLSLLQLRAWPMIAPVLGSDADVMFHFPLCDSISIAELGLFALAGSIAAALGALILIALRFRKLGAVLLGLAWLVGAAVCAVWWINERSLLSG